MKTAIGIRQSVAKATSKLVRRIYTLSFIETRGIHSQKLWQNSCTAVKKSAACGPHSFRDPLQPGPPDYFFIYF
jgi:hypothetical protein